MISASLKITPHTQSGYEQ